MTIAGISTIENAFQRANHDSEQNTIVCPQPKYYSAERHQANLSDAQHWSYLFLRNIKVNVFEEQLNELRKLRDGNANVDKEKVKCLHLEDEKGNTLYIPNVFVHRSSVHAKLRHGVKETQEVSVSGLVFLQGTVSDIQKFLDYNYPRQHLYRISRDSGQVARIADSKMQPFMKALRIFPERIRIINKLLEEVVKDNPKVRMLTGDFAGIEGHIVRIRGDRKLVFELEPCITVCISQIHKDEYEFVKATIVDADINLK